MLARLGLMLALVSIGLTLLFQRYNTGAWIFFGFAIVGLIELIVMLNYHHLLGVRIASAKEAQTISGEDTNNREILTIPISIRFPYLYELRDFRLRIVSGDEYAPGELYNSNGGIFGGGLGDVFTLSYRRRRAFASIAYVSGRGIWIGASSSHRSIGGEGRHRIALEILSEDKTITHKDFVLEYVQNRLTLFDGQ